MDKYICIHFLFIIVIWKIKEWDVYIIKGMDYDDCYRECYFLMFLLCLVYFMGRWFFTLEWLRYI